MGLPPSRASPFHEDSDADCSPQVRSLTPQVPVTVESQGIRCWALPCSLAVTKGILVSFFSSAY